MYWNYWCHTNRYKLKSLKTKPSPPLTKLVEAGQRLNSNRHFNSKVQKITSSRKLDNLLFREDFGETSKMVKTVGEHHQRYACCPTFYFKKLEGRYIQETVENNWVVQVGGSKISRDQRVSRRKASGTTVERTKQPHSTRVQHGLNSQKINEYYNRFVESKYLSIDFLSSIVNQIKTYLYSKSIGELQKIGAVKEVRKIKNEFLSCYFLRNKELSDSNVKERLPDTLVS
nr:unnamed protein product [Callosobruchus analis]